MSKRRPIKEGSECLALMIEIDETNYCELITNTGREIPSPYCDEAIKYMLSKNFHTYIDNIDKCTCKSQLRRLLEKGPPMWLNDKGVEELLEEDEYVEKIWYSSDDTIRSARLDGAPESEEEQKLLWEKHRDLLKFLPEKEENS